jgi:hypothetical protein
MCSYGEQVNYGRELRDRFNGSGPSSCRLRVRGCRVVRLYPLGAMRRGGNVNGCHNPQASDGVKGGCRD